ncbi:LapA family protein [Thiomicrorhabdus sediminis]|uniref:LapA family protein n=1 Tax=Thiomicrorhabdus sediminis TaxID=2580412 RepID=A0A4P9K567_9GAMM|nr:LapA family protein [Thiomicrorhabdus sediminis]QCU90112.1 LapA family protein [Thiomicrorhabdus sediminis]
MFKLLSLVLTLCFVFIGVSLGVLNPSEVMLDLFFVQMQLPLSVVMAVLFICGMLLGALFILMQVIRLNWMLRRKTKENQKLSDQIVQLKKAQVQQSADRLAKDVQRVEVDQEQPKALSYQQL